jgi:hypothetical protein
MKICFWQHRSLGRNQLLQQTLGNTNAWLTKLKRAMAY